METKRKHKFLDFSEVDPALENRNRFKYRVEFEQIESHYPALRVLGEWKPRSTSCGVVLTKMKIEDFTNELIEILDCKEDEIKICNLSVATCTGYTISKFM